MCAGKPDRNSAALGYFITPCVATLGTLLCYLLLPHLVSGRQAAGVWNQQNMSSDSWSQGRLHYYVFTDHFFVAAKESFSKFTNIQVFILYLHVVSDCVDSLFQEFARFYLKRSQLDALETPHKLLDSTGWSTHSLTQPASLSSNNLTSSFTAMSWCLHHFTISHPTYVSNPRKTFILT